MTQNKTSLATILSNLQSTSSGYDLLRYIGLPEVLGQDSNLILYVMGKSFARQAECATYNEIQEFFQHAGWGEIRLIQEKRRGFIYQLDGELVKARLETIKDIDFHLEAGFLAETIFQLTNKSCEGLAEMKKDHVLFHVLHN
ncbi:YslB family protein [Gracilibacillus caseinilyticus]|uniref:YslB family protein n=1 Tax=Gracilibacillus caseinilyticus TaxID=2932256 RepID=A0ABY4ERZ3_9BACI|nr:DUF2507 domain-containing protein [Gracilibacillus caseinilyticus]UOQ47200.1 YslB family protein [Gracilibacillus caseinilyticus]